jgi:predicted transglutaminase-like cysteine proteinase
MGSWVRSLVFAAVAGFALSAASASHASDPSFAKEFGRSLPPIGFVKFCVSNPGECKGVGRSVQRAGMTPERWSELYKINMRVNAEVSPVSDAELYGQAEHWAYPTDAGDCEDYLLLKKRELEAKGFSPSSLLITVVLDEKNEGHAVLTVATDDGDYILDNRRNDILLWNETGYTFLKRQSQKSPRDWVALTTTKYAVKAVAGN